MNVYDRAHELANAIKGCQEFKDYEELKAKVAENPELDKMIKDFQGKQFEMQTKQMIGEELDEEFMGNVQAMYQIIMKDPLATEYMQAEMRFSLMMNDVYKILGDAMGLAK
ncbi:MAG: YlbF family regulator [Clostridia bacterium]|nr:YlbF family regulator [Clostridia bacterium]